jgi:NAD(P)H-quinone oxidoreductase subunit 5
VPTTDSSTLTLVALLPAAAAAVAALAATGARHVEGGWRLARAASAVMVAGAMATIVARVADDASAGEVVRLDTLTAAMVSLIAVVGWAVIRYSATYLAGDPEQLRYVRRLLSTLAAVSVVVVANHLLVLVVAWMATSFAMHGLLTYYHDRPVAVAVAHKKFLLARLADVAMLGAVVAFWVTFDTLRIDAITAEAAATAAPTGARVGIFLVAIAALLKCAQLPFHGWLIQVMEAPTPVSALLHAGVVNLGGFVLLRFAPVVDAAVETRTMLIVVGAATAVAASLVMTTRVSIKVALAWSTCAQMGFMLVQCGIGLWGMALLHLLAHSVYKAHAFLSAGTTVRQTQRAQLAGRAPIPSVRSLALGTATTAGLTVAVGLVWQALPGTKEISAPVWVMLGIVALALTPLAASVGRARPITPVVAPLGVTIAYLALHELFDRMVPTGDQAPVALLAITAAAFAVLFVLQSASLVAPAGRLARRTQPWLYAGLFLDEAFTRVAFRVWPPPAARERPDPLPRPRSIAVVRTVRAGAAVPEAAASRVAAPVAWATPEIAMVGSDAS